MNCSVRKLNRELLWQKLKDRDLRLRGRLLRSKPRGRDSNSRDLRSKDRQQRQRVRDRD